MQPSVPGCRSAQIPDGFLQRVEPSPVTAEMRSDGSPRVRTCASSASTADGSVTASIFVAVTICGFLGKLAAEERQLAPNRFEVLDRIAARGAGYVYQVDEHLRPVQVLQKPVSKSFAFVRTFDQARDVSHDEAAVAAERDDAQIRRERGEGVVSDLRSRG